MAEEVNGHMDKTQLQGDQYPKGLNEDEVRKIAREEAASALAALKDAVANTPQRADGNINGRDFYDTLDIVVNQLREPEPVEPER